MVTPLKRLALLIELYAEDPHLSSIKEERRLFHMTDGYTFMDALKLDEISVPLGQQPRWFLSTAEAESTQERLTPAVQRALTFWLVQIHTHRRNASASISVITEDEVNRLSKIATSSQPTNRRITK